MHPKRREDIHLAASVVTLVLGIVALATWIASWPSTVVPTIFFVIGLIGLAVILLAVALVGLESAAVTAGTHAVPAWFVLSMVLVEVPGEWIAMRPLQHPGLVRVVGGVVLGLALATSAAVAAVSLRERYRARRLAPRHAAGDGSEQLAFELDGDDGA